MPQQFSVSRDHRNLLVAASAAAFVLIAMGGIVCSTNSSGGCPDWPRCQGRLVPPLQINALIEYTHRAVALLTMLLVVAATVLGYRRKDSGAALRLLPMTAIVLIMVVAVFGALAVLIGLSPLLAAIDLGTALIVVTLIVTTATVASIRVSRPPLHEAPASGGSLWKLSMATLASLFVVIVSGVLVARGSVMRCVGGPLHLGTWGSLGDTSSGNSIRQVLGAIAALLVLTVLTTAFRDRSADFVTRRWSALFGILFVIEAGLNAGMVSIGATAPLLVASAVVTAAAWTALVVVTVRARLLATAPAEAAARSQLVRQGRASS